VLQVLLAQPLRRPFRHRRPLQLHRHRPPHRRALLLAQLLALVQPES
jgi:hypothetical protein